MEFHRSESATAWVGSLAFGLMFFLGPLTTVLCEHFGCRVVTCVGGLLSFAGLLSTSFVTSFPLLYFTYGFLWGAGTSLCYFASLVSLPLHFRNYLSLAYGIAIAGAGLGVPPTTWAINQLITHYNWRITMRILAGMSLLMSVSSVSYGGLATVQEHCVGMEKSNASGHSKIGTVVKLKLGILEFLSLNPWKNKAFAVWAVSLSFIAFGNFIPFVFLISIANEIGIPSSKSALLLGYQAITQTAARIAFGRLVNYPRMNRVVSVQIIGLVLAVNATLFPLAKTYSSLVVYVVVFGFFDGSLAVMFGMGTLYIVGERLAGRAFGNLCFAAAIGNVLGPPVAGFVFDVFGKYDIAFFLSGAFMTFGVCLLFLVPWLMPEKMEVSEESAVLLSDDASKQSTNYKQKPRAIYSFPIEAAFFAQTRCDHVLQHSVSMGTLRDTDTSPLMKSAIFRAWSAAAHLHYTDSLNGSSGYESDYNRQSSSTQYSEVIDKSLENKPGSITLITPAMSFDDIEVIVQREKLEKESWGGSATDLYSVMFESLLERETPNPRTSLADDSSSESDSKANTETRIILNFSQSEFRCNLDLCRETIL
ncbi:Monocarboxylate transporter 10 [Stylophora pistillata]|uniref:Monocarboxylate transporter 10 n=3 Tax=Stylophora pistillata TaxID=50429 RepID=A0A2B4RWG6_STYPI|nr:Monocarboxylate transporter 10 [Stylophora pistillata]